MNSDKWVDGEPAIKVGDRTVTYSQVLAVFHAAHRVTSAIGTKAVREACSTLLVILPDPRGDDEAHGGFERDRAREYLREHGVEWRND